MAIVTSHLVNAMRGSVKGDPEHPTHPYCSLSYSKNQHHAIIVRKKPIPSQPVTPRKTAFNDAGRWAIGQWNTVSQATRDGWEQYAKSLTILDPLGYHSTTGRNTFLACLTLRRFIKLMFADPYATITDAPTLPGRISFNFEGPYPPPSGIGWTYYIINPNPFPILVIYQASYWHPITRNRWHGPWKTETFYWHILANSTLTNHYTRGTLNNVIFTRWRACVSDAPHRLSPLLYTRVVCVPA